MSNLKEDHENKEKNKDSTKKKKSFSLFNCEKDEFKDWFDPL